MILPELKEAYSRYLKNGNAREYNRFIHFSSYILRINPHYNIHYGEVIEWMKSQRMCSTKNKVLMDTTGLKNVDIYVILEHFASLGFPRCHTTAKRFSECLKVWLAAFWEVYGPILKGATKIKSLNRIEISLSDKNIAIISTKTGITLTKNRGFFLQQSSNFNHINTEKKHEFIQLDETDILEKISIRNLLNSHPITY